MEYKNPRRTMEGSIDIELNHPEFGWIPFTASPNDDSEFGRALFFEIDAKGEGHVAPYVGPSYEEYLLNDWRQSTRVSAFQAKAMLLQAGYWEEVNGLLASADPITKMAWDTAQEFERLSPTILELAEALGITDEQLDDLFRFASTIKA